MVIALISVAFVCLLAAGLCLGAALRFMARCDALQRMHAEVSGAAARAQDAVNQVQQQVSKLQTEHWESASARITSVTGRVADLEAECESLKESQRDFQNKINAREKRATKVEKEEVDNVARELPTGDMSQDDLLRMLIANGQAAPMASQEPATPVNGRRRFGEKASPL